MKLKELVRSPKVFRITIAILFSICLIMLWLYFNSVDTSEFSKSSNEWANFGQYFGSITGLLAFAGVLYSASLSEERVKEAKEEMKKREERDQFFKLLDLFQNKVENFEIEEYKGLTAFKIMGENANKCLVSYVALHEAIKRNFSPVGYDDEGTNIFTGYISSINSSTMYRNKQEYFQNVINNFNYNKLLEISPKSEQYFRYIVNQNISTDNQYKYLKYIGTLILKKYGFILDSYLDSFHYLISTLKTFKSECEYNNLLRSQLSRYESLIILFCAVSNKSDYRVISNLQES